MKLDFLNKISSKNLTKKYAYSWMLFSYFLTLINTLVFAFIGHALWQAPNLLPNFFK